MKSCYTLILALLLAACNDKTTQPKTVTGKQVWNYEEKEDKMSEQKQYCATSTSTNTINFPAPYEGGSTFELTVRNNGTTNQVLLNTSKGQFISSLGDETVRIKFDDEQPINVTYTMPESAEMDVVFLNVDSKFIAKLKAAKKLMVEAPFFQADRQVIYFDVTGLNWAH